MKQEDKIFDFIDSVMGPDSLSLEDCEDIPLEQIEEDSISQNSTSFLESSHFGAIVNGVKMSGGVLIPIVVLPLINSETHKKYRIVAGTLYFHAAKAANSKSIFAKILDVNMPQSQIRLIQEFDQSEWEEYPKQLVGLSQKTFHERLNLWVRRRE